MMRACSTAVSLVVLGLTTSLLWGCAGHMAEAERAHMLKQWQRLAFSPLIGVIEEGELRKVLLEMGPWEPAGPSAVVESEDPEILRLVREGLRTAERPVEVTGIIVGVAGQGRAVIYSKTLCAEIWLTQCGFSVGSPSPADYTCFVSPVLTGALGGLYSRKTGLHMDPLLLRGLSDKTSDLFLPIGLPRWERVWRPRD